MKYDVHMYAVVRIKVTDVEAENQIEAIKAAEPIAWDFAHKHLTGDVRFVHNIEDFEFAEEMVYALVDERGDEDYLNSRYYAVDLSSPDEWSLHDS